jgi:peroxin-19
MSTQKRPLVDEDVDDLDDVLDDFAAPGPSTKPAPSTSASKAPKPPAPAAPGADLDEEAFARELAEGMEALMRELGGGISTTTGAGPPSSSKSAPKPGQADRARDAVFMEAWEQLLAEGMGGEQGKAAAEAGVGKEREREEVEDAFQKTIREAMDRMRTAEDGLQADAQAGAQAGGDPLAQLLASLGEMGEGGAGEQSEEELQEMLEGMMAQLMSKEILHEPLKELVEKFPGWLKENASKLSEGDKKRYEGQQVCARKIIEIFEKPGYSDDDTETATQIMTLMNEMQGYGSPPSELMGPLPTGFETGPDGLPKIPEGCLIS